MYEYVISCGEGTLIDFGVAYSGVGLVRSLREGEQLTIEICDEDCTTGE